MTPHDAQRLAHIIDYCEDIENHILTAGQSHDAFLTNAMLQHSVAFCILQIGELVGKLSDELRASTANEINWSAIKGMRNIVVHNYGNIDIEEVWNAASCDVPRLKAFCKKQLA